MHSNNSVVVVVINAEGKQGCNNIICIKEIKKEFPGGNISGYKGFFLGPFNELVHVKIHAFSKKLREYPPKSQNEKQTCHNNINPRIYLT